MNCRAVYCKFMVEGIVESKKHSFIGCCKFSVYTKFNFIVNMQRL